MNEKRPSELLQRIDLGVKRGIMQALADHKKAGRSIAVLKDGKVVKISPEKIYIDEEYLKPL